jgi:hypothetical protein
MGCTVVQLEGVTAILCTRGRPPRRRRCSACPRPATLQCDGPPRRAGATSCDRYLCEACAVEVGPERHLCAECHAAPELPLAASGRAP